jgi:hypothetical protein
MTELFLIIVAAYIGCVGIPAARRYDRAMQNPASTEYKDAHKENQS